MFFKWNKTPDFQRCKTFAKWQKEVEFPVFSKKYYRSRASFIADYRPGNSYSKSIHWAHSLTVNHRQRYPGLHRSRQGEPIETDEMQMLLPGTSAIVFNLKLGQPKWPMVSLSITGCSKQVYINISCCKTIIFRSFRTGEDDISYTMDNMWNANKPTCLHGFIGSFDSHAKMVFLHQATKVTFNILWVSDIKAKINKHHIMMAATHPTKRVCSTSIMSSGPTWECCCSRFCPARIAPPPPQALRQMEVSVGGHWKGMQNMLHFWGCF